MTTALRPVREIGLLPPEASLTDAIRWAVAHAELAPSELNTQPWLFRARVDEGLQVARVEIVLDRARLLRHLDPDAREAVVACGAALLHLQLCLRAAALGASLQYAPDRTSPDLLAVLTVSGRALERPQDRVLREAIASRGCRRAPFEPGRPSQALLAHLVAEAGYEGALLSVLDVPSLEQLRELDQQALAREAADPGRTWERAGWARGRTASPEDGVPGAAHRVGLRESLAELRRIRHVDEESGHDDDGYGTVIVIGSACDDRPSLLRAGAGLERVLLAAADAGFCARFVNNAVRYPDLRQKVGALAGLDHPQAVLHLGLGQPDSGTGRRPLEDVLELQHTHLESR